MNDPSIYDRWIIRAAFYAGWMAAVTAITAPQSDDSVDAACARFLEGDEFQHAVTATAPKGSD